MAGLERKRCPKCGKWYVYSWQTEEFLKRCTCPEEN